MKLKVKVLDPTTSSVTKIIEHTFQSGDDTKEWSGVKFTAIGEHMKVESDAVGIKLKWDTYNTVYVTAQRDRHRGKGLKGLCGDYDGVAHNDFQMYTNPASFGNKWKAESVRARIISTVSDHMSDHMPTR